MTKIKIHNPVLGVPITFLNYHNPEEWNVVGQLNVGCFMDLSGWHGSNGKNMLSVGGGTAYKRILIRRK